MDRQPSTRRREQGPDEVLSRRKIVRRAVGAVAAGAGAVVLTDLAASPAKAAALATTVESGALAPAVVNLTDAATITVDASLGNDFRVTIGGNRTVGTPANATDGQKATFQVTQGSGGPFTLTWASGYEFSAALAQPTLSTTAGQTDLLGFIYNAAKGKWLFVAFVSGFTGSVMSSPSPTPTTTSASPSPSPSTTQSGSNYRLFASVAGPSTPVSYSGPFICGVVATVTTGGCWLTGYWWWVCPSGQPTGPQKFALWCVYDTASGSLVPNSTVTSGTLTAGQWNYVPLPAPLPLAIDATYVAATGFSGGFPDTNNQFAAGEPYAAGIVSGPLTAFSDGSGSNPSPFKNDQAVFSVAGTDPTATMPIYGSSSSNFWMDVQVTTSPPAGTSYRLWPGYPRVPGTIDSDTAGYTLGTEFKLTQSCTLNNIWFYSAPTAGALPTRCAIWNVSTQSVVSGTDNTSPTWSGAAAAGWAACAYSGVTLPAGDYKVAVFYGGGQKWYQATNGYWGTGGPGGNGITAGPVTAPGTSAATSPGQATYHAGSWAYPVSYASSGGGENYWLDVEVTPAS
jgi:Domain of unknown function (DUF4082)